ncbi:MAG: hypothetical protein IJW00_02190 [Clostridia bacterium]|nr:hypothetical protein [Clostridia bacterium]
MRGDKYLARPEDGQAILDILESSASKGGIELLYTRRPDAYASYMKEFGEARVFVSRRGDRLAGTCAELVRDVYINGQPAKAAYLCGLKKQVAPGEHAGFGPDLFFALQRDDIDFYYCSVVKENGAARHMLEGNHRLLRVSPLADFRTYMLSPKVRIKAPVYDYIFRQATPDDHEALLAFYRAQGQNKDLFPVISAFEDFQGLSIRNFYLLLRGKEILAAGALWRQSDYKQYVVKAYRGVMKGARALNPLLSLLGYIKLPPRDVPLDFPMLSFFLCRDDDEAAQRVFLKEMVREVRKTDEMFVIGLPREHAVSLVLDKVPNLHFDTTLYEISFPWSQRPNNKVRAHHIFPECGLL